MYFILGFFFILLLIIFIFVLSKGVLISNFCSYSCKIKGRIMFIVLDNIFMVFNDNGNLYLGV